MPLSRRELFEAATALFALATIPALPQLRSGSRYLGPAEPATGQLPDPLQGETRHMVWYDEEPEVYGRGPISEAFVRDYRDAFLRQYQQQKPRLRGR